ncbi:MAG: imidazoleglycerol-phosphate dehydratase HisB [Oscillospiraceae bacterium]
METLKRYASVSRITNETDISIKINLDDSTFCKISTGIGFFDHMLTALSKHSEIGLEILAKGDLEVDCHHTIEDVGIVLGKSFKDALKSMTNIARYGSAYIPMDEALGFVSLDISNRPFLKFDVTFKNERIGDMDTQMVEEFFRAFAFNAGITLHISAPYGSNDHHIAEAIFKAMAHALKIAIVETDTILTTKGVI